VALPLSVRVSGTRYEAAAGGGLNSGVLSLAERGACHWQAVPQCMRVAAAQASPASSSRAPA
jgi:hypothetical protein